MTDTESRESQTNLWKQILRVCSGIATVLGAIKAIQDQWDWWHTHHPMAALSGLPKVTIKLFSLIIQMIDVILCYIGAFCITALEHLLSHLIVFGITIIVAAILSAILEPYDTTKPAHEQVHRILSITISILLIYICIRTIYVVFTDDLIWMSIHPERAPKPDGWYKFKWIYRIAGIVTTAKFVTSL